MEISLKRNERCSQGKINTKGHPKVTNKYGYKAFHKVWIILIFSITECLFITNFKSQPF